MNEYYNYNTSNEVNGGATPTGFYQPQPEKKEKKKSGSKKIVAMALCFSLLGGAVGTGGTYLGMNYLKNDTTESQSSDSGSSSENTVIYSSEKKLANVANTTAKSGEKMTASEVYQNNVNSTVGITTEINTNYFGYKTTAAASGSGFIISANGYIITNNHVIEDASKITVTLYDGKKYDAELIGADESNDVAVLKIDADGLTPVVLGSSSELSVGQDVVAIGNPLGELTFSLTSGVVSALDRTITTQENTMNLIQTDTAINSGNSGGALFNMYGEVVGITNAKYSSSGYSSEASIDNIGFAIPIDSVKNIIQSLIENGYVSKPYIGVKVGNVSEEATGYGIPTGVSIKSVTDDSPADKAGLKENDIITEINGKEIKTSTELITLVKTCSKGDELECKVYREGEYKELTITVDEKKSTSDNDTDKESDNNDEQQTQKSERSGRSSDEYESFGGFGDFSEIPEEFFGY